MLFLRSFETQLCLNTNAVTCGVLLCLTVYQEFDHLLEEQSPIESYIEWLDTMVDRCVVKVGAALGTQPVTGLCDTCVVQSPAVSNLNVPEQSWGPRVLRTDPALLRRGRVAGGSSLSLPPPHPLTQPSRHLFYQLCMEGP